MIRIECPECGTRLRGPDNAAGTVIKCPKCAIPIRVPEQVYEAEPLDAEELPRAADPYADDESDAPYGVEGGDSPYGVSEPTEERRRPCPMCGEMIIATAVKCRFCDEILDPKLKKSKGKRGKDADADNLSTGDLILCLFCCPAPGFILGVVYMIQGKGKGIKALGLSIAASFFWYIVAVIIAQQGRPGP